MKTRPWKFFRFGPQRAMLPALFEHTILRRKTVFLGSLKSSENMLRKSIQIGLSVLKNNRTIGEPKNLQGG